MNQQLHATSRRRVASQLLTVPLSLLCQCGNPASYSVARFTYVLQCHTVVLCESGECALERAEGNTQRKHERGKERERERERERDEEKERR